MLVLVLATETGGPLRTDIPSLCEDDSEEEDDKEYTSTDPAIGREWRRCIQ